MHKSPQLFISGFDRNVAQLFIDPSLHQCLHRPIKSEQKHVLICYNNTRVARWWAFNFAKVPPRYVLCMPRYDELKVVFLKSVHKKVLSRKKKNLSTRGFEPTTSYTLVRRSTTWTVCAVVFKGMLLKFSLHLGLLRAVETERKHAWTRDNNLRVGGWWALHYQHRLCRFAPSLVSKQRDRQTDRQTDRQLFSFIYIYI